MAFEQLVAEAAAKKESKKSKSKDKKAEAKDGHHHPAADVAADAPNVPKAKE